MDNTPPPDVVVVGAGIVGLTSALCLSRAGYKVAVVAREFPGDQTTNWASPWAGAAIMPQPTEDEREIRMQKASFRQWGALAAQGPETGVHRVTATEYWDDRPQPTQAPWYSTYLPAFRALSPSELPKGTLSGNTFKAYTIDPSLTLPYLHHQLQTHHSILFHQQTLPSLSIIREQFPKTPLIINASGLGAATLAHDPHVHAIRGQTILLNCASTPQTAALASEIHFRRGNEYTYFIPRRYHVDSAILGGIEDPGNFSTTADPEVRRDILNRVHVMTKGFLGAVDLQRDVICDVVGFRPGREGGYRVERVGEVVHVYGFGGAGYRYSFGAAEEVVRLAGGLRVPGGTVRAKL
ncbi:hypothetical protein MBLNU230_g0736t1 [Neophaeotheca triangularis]